jgi:hypothetical protein
MQTLLRLLLLAAVVMCAVADSDAQAPPAHRIQVRTIKGTAEFFDTKTGQKFTPRGNNYVRLAEMKKLSEPTSMLYHSTFNEGRYEKKRAAAALDAMAAKGYNVVRVFLNHATEGSIRAGSGGFSKPYMDNLADFLVMAKAKKLYVIPTIDWIPVPNPGRAVGKIWCSDFQCTNVHILTREGLQANKDFFVALVKELLKRKAPTDYILAYELRNELTFESDLSPLTLTRGTVNAANGKSYDLSSERQKTAMLEEGLVYWLDQVRAAIRGVDPTALVTVGFIPPQKPHATRAGDPKLSVTAPVITSSTLDFFDIHVYPAPDKLTMKEYAENFGIVGVKAKPVILGEYGALFGTYTSVQSAAKALVEWQSASTTFGIDGWLLWSWDMDLGRDCWAATDSAGLIANALAPATRSNPVSAAPAGTFLSASLVKSARASGSYEDQGPSLAIDGTMRQWSSGGFPPQWLEVTLNKAVEISEVRLTVGQSPEGPTVHQLWIKPPDRDYTMLHEFKGTTKDFQVLEFRPKAGVVASAVRIVTTASPSWVGWREIEVFERYKQ